MSDYELPEGCQVEGLNEMYMKYFGHKTDGTFVEVGAYDGRFWGNTWGLAKAGWHGVYIEPIPEFVAMCRETHKNHNVEIIQTAIGSFTGKVTMHMAGPLSTFSEYFYKSKAFGSFYDPRQSVEVPIDTLDNVLEKTKIQPSFDVLVIDTEGTELDVLSGFNVAWWRPKMIIVEECEQNENKAELAIHVPAIERVLSSYKKIYSGWVNSVYVLYTM
jgi:FkbM family methyltransferase